MSQTTTTLRERRTSVWREAKNLADQAAEQNRSFDSAEEARWTELNAELDRLDERLTELHESEHSARRTEQAFAQLEGGRVAPRSPADTDLDLRFRQAILESDRRPITVPCPERRSGYRPGIEQRDLLTTTGGGLVPTSFYDRIQRHLVESSAILAAGATMLNTATGEPLRVPRSTAHSSAAIVAQGALIGESDPGLGSVELGAHKYGFLTQVSSELAQDSAFDLLGYLAEQSGIALGNAFGSHAITGTGTGQPRGIVTDATVGVTGATGVGGAFTADDLIDLHFSVASPYSRSTSAAWLMNTATLGAVRKLRVAPDGDYVFTDNVPAGSGAAGSVLGRPVFIDPTVAAIGNGNDSVIFGDLSRYWVRQAGELRFQRSDDYAFDRDLATFRGLLRIDGALVDTSGAVKTFRGAAT